MSTPLSCCLPTTSHCSKTALLTRPCQDVAVVTRWTPLHSVHQGIPMQAALMLVSPGYIHGSMTMSLCLRTNA